MCGIHSLCNACVLFELYFSSHLSAFSCSVVQVCCVALYETQSDQTFTYDEAGIAATFSKIGKLVEECKNLVQHTEQL